MNAPRLMQAEGAWSSGAARCFLEHPVMGGSSSAVVVRCALGLLPPELAIVDTASTFSVLGGATADFLGPELEDTGLGITMLTRYGRLDGHLGRLGIRLLAEPGWGADLVVNATVLVLPAWPGPTMLGVSGFLDRIRVAIDPGSDLGDAVFLFGAMG
jgi:hypothetical protein